MRLGCCAGRRVPVQLEMRRRSPIKVMERTHEETTQRKNSRPHASHSHRRQTLGLRVIRQLDKEQLTFRLAGKPTAIGKTARNWTLRIARPNESGSKIEYSKLPDRLTRKDPYDATANNRRILGVWYQLGRGARWRVQQSRG